MDLLESINTRRSIRKFTTEKVEEDQINKLLKAAMNAPSAGNERPWHFVIISERHILDMIPTIHPHSAMLREAPVAILVCGDESLEKYRGFWVQDCAAATQNILLGAHSIGLGGVWLGVFPVEERIKGVRAILNIPSHIIPFSIIALGHPAETKAPIERFDQKRVHYNIWSDEAVFREVK